MKRVKEAMISRDFLDKTTTDVVFVFGDNAFRIGQGGAAALRYHPKSYGFVTKVSPGGSPEDYFTSKNYMPVFEQEVKNLIRFIESEPTKTFYVSKVGAGLANAFGIWEAIIEPKLPALLAPYNNVVLLWD